MTSEKIRQVSEKDYQGISDLYKNRKSIKELKWLYSNPSNRSSYNANVAINREGKIIGVIGYSSNNYTLNKQNIKGVIFMTWMVSPEYKGFAGITLLKNISQYGEFSIALAGSDLGQSFYSMLHYKHISNCDYYYKLLNVSNIFKTIKRKSFIKSIAMIAYLTPTYLKNPFKTNCNRKIELIPYNGHNFKEEKEYQNVFKKEITKDYIDWMLDCPVLESHAFLIKNENDFLGICVLYIQNKNKVKKGRIIHMPFLGYDDSLWVTVLNKCIKFLKDNQCHIVSGLSNHKINGLAYEKVGFRKINKHSKPLYIKDPKNILNSIHLKNWHLQFSEGDKMHRGI